MRQINEWLTNLLCWLILRQLVGLRLNDGSFLNLSMSLVGQSWSYFFLLLGPQIATVPSTLSTQLSMKFVLLINLKLLIIVNSFMLNIAEHEFQIFSANKYENANYYWHVLIY